MAAISLEFENDINISLQKKADSTLTAHDIVFYINGAGNIVRLGPCIGISGRIITVDKPNNITAPAEGNFVFFGKDTQVGTSGLLGYYAEVEMKNNATTAAELHAVSTEFFISSK
tara:strand:- start:3114 stop:3458 length:345 start_codon:yes stop_codon:yes gene_type:complete